MDFDTIVDLAMRGSRWRAPDMSEKVASGIASNDRVIGRWPGGHGVQAGEWGVTWVDGFQTPIVEMSAPGSGWELVEPGASGKDLPEPLPGTKRWYEQLAGRCTGTKALVSNGGPGVVRIELRKPVEKAKAEDLWDELIRFQSEPRSPLRIELYQVAGEVRSRSGARCGIEVDSPKHTRGRTSSVGRNGVLGGDGGGVMASRLLTDVGRAALALLELNRKPTVPEVHPVVEAYRALPGNSAGGSLHVVLDDGNVDDGSVQFCIEWADDAGDEDGVALGKVLLRMSKTQRKKLG